MYVLAELLRTWMTARGSEDERGASIVEYCLLLAVVSSVCLASASFLSDAVNSAFSSAKF